MLYSSQLNSGCWFPSCIPSLCWRPQHHSWGLSPHHIRTAAVGFGDVWTNMGMPISSSESFLLSKVLCPYKSNSSTLDSGTWFSGLPWNADLSSCPPCLHVHGQNNISKGCVVGSLRSRIEDLWYKRSNPWVLETAACGMSKASVKPGDIFVIFWECTNNLGCGSALVTYLLPQTS